MKMHLLRIYSLTVFIIITFYRFTEAGNNVCEDKGRCTNVNCKAPGIAANCKKTCGLCTDGEVCEAGQTKQSDGTCSCPRGKSGPSCNEACNRGCLNDRCHKQSGECRTGCKICYTGAMCSDVKPECDCDTNDTCTCKPGYYGNGCMEICNDRCKKHSCNSDGECTHGCGKGYFGLKCDKQCSHCVNNECSRDTCTNGCKERFYGPTCSSSCSDKCKGKSCNQTDGRCNGGCLPEWFGTRCDKPCPDNCVDNTCYQNGGRCDQGCRSGLHGDKCDISCPVNCFNESCDRSDGSCSGCKPGYIGHHCNMSCVKYCAGSSCQHNDSTITCDGCRDGYRGSHCDKPCPSHCSVCEQKGERCSSCSPGWFGDTCETSCNNCVAGICNISDNCFGKHCNTTNNDRENRTCIIGCKDGWWGDFCDDECTQYCLRCTRSDGVCLECEGTKSSADCKHQVTYPNVVVPWVAVPCFLIMTLLVLAFILLRKSPTGITINTLSLIKPSYKTTLKRSNTQNEADSESQPLKEGDIEMGALLRAYVRKAGDPYAFDLPTGINSRVFSTYVPSTLIQEEVWRSDTPFPCQLPDEPQLGRVWSTEILVENFRDYVRTMKKSCELTNQFFDLPSGRLGPCNEGERQVNAFKNRYRNVLPYDHSRVTLQYIDNTPGSDYINANYISGYGTTKASVATQGPYADVLWDFWRMVWEIDTGKIVMLTNLVENGRMKCGQYWPDLGQPRFNYDGVFVQCVTENKLMKYTVRTFTVQMEEEPPRTVKQYHFTTWPDKGVPRDVTSLVDFHQVVKQSPASRYGPIIVHCSAGVGRTGTYLALDYLIAQARAEGVVDVYQCVARLRHERIDAIQTEKQYEFLHDALVEALSSGDRPSKEDRTMRLKANKDFMVNQRTEK